MKEEYNKEFNLAISNGKELNRLFLITLFSSISLIIITLLLFKFEVINLDSIPIWGLLIIINLSLIAVAFYGAKKYYMREKVLITQDGFRTFYLGFCEFNEVKKVKYRAQYGNESYTITMINGNKIVFSPILSDNSNTRDIFYFFIKLMNAEMNKLNIKIKNNL